VTARANPRSPWVGLLAAAASVTAVTALIFALREAVPVLSTGVLYLLAVLAVSGYWGLWLGLITSVASALAFNFFHIPPTGRFTIAASENWVALAVYLVAAVVVSAFAEAARSRHAEAGERRREADLAMELALVLLGAEPDALPRAAAQIGQALGLRQVRLEQGWVDARAGERAIPLLADGQRIGTAILQRDAEAAPVEQFAERVAPALGVLMDARARRARLADEVVAGEALRRSDVLKTALLRAVSHDLRSPLTAIAAAAGGIDSETLDSSGRKVIKDVISGETERLTALVTNLLDLSRLESGSLHTNSEPISIDEVVEAAADAAAIRDTALDIALKPGLPLVQVDPAQLERALSNLLENAVRHSDRKPVAVRANAHGKRLHVRVTDQGPGVAAAEVDRIFEPFYSAPGSTGGGSGLGLAIAKGLVEANGGRIWVRSLPGQGATFGIDLPLAEPSGEDGGVASGEAG
jgi:two-component system sensor histidine kinase KdpD